jgi:plastocyanin
MKKWFWVVLGLLVVVGMLGVVSCSSSSPLITTPGGNTQVKPTPGGTTGPDFKPAAVDIKNLAFSPATLTVSIGTTVTWTNDDSMTHTVTSNSGVFDSGDLPQGKTFSFTFNTAGTFDYHCAIHPSMVGHIIVQ